jgi:hypothetical protein
MSLTGLWGPRVVKDQGLASNSPWSECPVPLHHDRRSEGSARAEQHLAQSTTQLAFFNKPKCNMKLAKVPSAAAHACPCPPDPDAEKLPA